MYYYFIIPRRPKGKDRPRKGKFGNIYTPQATKDYEEEVALIFNKCYPGFEPIKEAVELVITIVFAIPKNAKKLDKIDMLNGKIKPTKKPDFDNVAKIISDALNGVAYVDDSQICSAVIKKEYGIDNYTKVELRKI